MLRYGVQKSGHLEVNGTYRLDQKKEETRFLLFKCATVPFLALLLPLMVIPNQIRFLSLSILLVQLALQCSPSEEKVDQRGRLGQHFLSFCFITHCQKGGQRGGDQTRFTDMFILSCFALPLAIPPAESYGLFITADP